MAVNRFVNIDWDKPISSFVPLPFEAAYAAGEKIQKNFDSGKAISGEIDKLSQAVKVIPNDEPAKQYMLDQYRSAIKETVDKYKGDYASADYQREANNIVDQFKNDTRLSVFNNNIDRYKELNENLKNPEKARDIHHSLGEFYNPDKSIKYNDPVNPVAFSPTYSTKAGDRPKTLNEIFQGVTEDGTPTSRISQTAHTIGEKMYYIDYDGQRKEITKDKISNVAYANLDNYLSTEAGTHELRSALENLKGQGLLPQNFNTYNVNSGNYKSILGSIATGNKRKSPVYDKQGKKTGEKEYDESLAEYLRDDIVDNIFAGGKKFIHRMETGKYDRSGVFDPTSDYTRKKIEEEATTTEYLPSSLVGNEVDLTKFKSDEGSGFFDTKMGSIVKNLWYGMTGEVDMSKYGTKVYKFTPEQEKIYEQAVHFYGKTALGGKEKGDMVNQYIKDWSAKKLNIAYNQYTNPKKVEDMNNIYFGKESGGAYAASNKKMKLMLGDGPVSGQGQDVMKEYGNKDKYVINVEGDLTPDNPYFAAGKVVTVRDKSNGEVLARYAMEGSQQEVDKNKGTHELFKRIKYNIQGEEKITDAKGNKYIVKYIEKPGDVNPNAPKSNFLWSDKFNIPTAGSGQATILAIPLGSDGKPLKDNRGYDMAVQTPYGNNPVNDLVDLINSGGPTNQFTPVKDYIHNR